MQEQKLIDSFDNLPLVLSMCRTCDSIPLIASQAYAAAHHRSSPLLCRSREDGPQRRNTLVGRAESGAQEFQDVLRTHREQLIVVPSRIIHVQNHRDSNH